MLVTSYNGTLVPLKIVFEKSIELDGSHPNILNGYDTYGIVSENFCWAGALASVERDGALARGHILGGGEYGEDWHVGGMVRTKLKTVYDFIACGPYLIDQTYVKWKRLAAEGVGAGGITVGRGLTIRPDLLKGMRRKCWTTWR